MQELTTIAQDTQAFVEGNTAPQVASQEDYAKAGDLLKVIANRIKSLNEKRLGMTRPLDNTKKQIMDEFKRMTEPLEALEQSIKGKMLDWYRAEEARQAEERRKEEERVRKEQEAQRKAEEEAEKAGVPDLDIETPQAPIAPPKVQPEIKTQRGAVATITMRDNWTWEIESEADIPREWLTVDQAKITRAVKAGERSIKGIKIFNQKTPVTR